MTGGESIRRDLLAGLTVAMVGLPQCLAYAMMSGVPPIYGIVTAAVPGLIAALFGRSAQVVTGPTNTTGLLVLSALFPFLGANGLIGPEGLPALATIALLAGVIRLIVGFAGGATVIRFVPESVLVGFTAGAGVLIAAMQLDEALGLPPVNRARLFGEIEALVTYFRGGVLPEIPSTIMMAAVVVALLLGTRLQPKVPVALLLLVAFSILSWALGWDRAAGLPVIADRAPVPVGWPEPGFPDLRLGLIQQFFVPSLAITLLGTLELAVTARAGGARPDMKREILAQGWANVAGAFSGSLPASASLTRSALLALAGARTRLAPASAAIFVAPILFFAGPAIAYIPQAALAGILFVTAYHMIQWRAAARMWRATRATRMLLVVTFSSTLLMPLEWAILMGAGLGLVIHLARTSVPRIRLLEPIHPDLARLTPVKSGDRPETVVIEVSGDLHYAAVEPFLVELEHRLPVSAKNVVMDLSHAHEMRFTALLAIERFATDLAKKGIRLVLAGVSDEVLEMMKASRSELEATPAEAEPHLSLKKCLRSIEEKRYQSSG